MAALFFKRGFVGAIKKFQAQGYPPASISANFLNPYKVLNTIPRALFGSQPSPPHD